MNRTRWVANKPKCPFYKYTERACVYCDGEEFSSLRISFPDPASRIAYMMEYCGKAYKKCPVYDSFVRHLGEKGEYDA